MTDFRTKATRDALRKPFEPEQIGKLEATAKRPELDFVGHAAVTDRLNAHVPDWSYTVDELFSVGSTVWIRGTMTIGGISRVEYGDGDNPKEAIGNFIRRAAMRFGVAIDLWSRQELEASGEPDTGAELGKAPAGHRGEGVPRGSGWAPSSHQFPVNPIRCDHKLASGAWVPWILLTDNNSPNLGKEVCPKCGTPKLTAVEGTMEDLGAPYGSA